MSVTTNAPETSLKSSAPPTRDALEHLYRQRAALENLIRSLEAYQASTAPPPRRRG